MSLHEYNTTPLTQHVSGVVIGGDNGIHRKALATHDAVNPFDKTTRCSINVVGIHTI
jgi:hypothetical protein